MSRSSPTSSRLRPRVSPRISAHAIADAARALHDAKRIWITGYRSCRSVAELLNYELRLFRPELGADRRRVRP